ncbi:MAG: trypsin-like peptidase domain-containing protein [Saprospiraceae bacterium]|nr:trypsin-like peptidase domain-containing protein [Lewinella sp.]
MKHLFSMLIAGMIGGLVTFGGIYLLQDEPLQPPVAAVPTSHFVKNVNQSPGTTSVPAPFDFKEAARKAMPAVVHISSTVRNSGEDDESTNPFRHFFDQDDTPQIGTGSGVIYSSDGYIITNNHVVDHAEDVEVTLYDNRTFKAKVVGTDKKTDLAVIKIDATDLPVLEAGDSDIAEVGEWVLAVGNPFDLTSTVTAGIISAKGRSIRILGGADAIEAFIQTDAVVNPGNSGGALIDTQGRLLGINTAIATRTGGYQGYSFAIPVNLVTRIIDDIIEYGSFQRAYLGVSIAAMDSEDAEELGIDLSQGVIILDLINGGSAQYAGLQEKDVIVRIDGKDIKGVPELQEIVGRAKVGDNITVTVVRHGQEVDVPVRLKAYDN